MKRTRRIFEIGKPADSSRAPRRRAVADSAFMVKSRRSASFRQSRPKRTLAWRPKVSTSSRSVVTSNGRLSITTVIGAVLDAGRHRLEARGADAADHLVGHGGGGEIDVADRLAEQRVAHRAADHARLLAVAIEHRKQPRQRALAQPGAHP